MSSPSFLPIVLPRARIGRASPATGPDGSTKGSPSFGASEPASRSASDAVVFRSTDAHWQIRPIAPGAGGPDRATGSPELWWPTLVGHGRGDGGLSRRATWRYICAKSRDCDPCRTAHHRRVAPVGNRAGAPWRPRLRRRRRSSTCPQHIPQHIPQHMELCHDEASFRRRMARRSEIRCG